jgi:hypothetical protein
MIVTIETDSKEVLGASKDINVVILDKINTAGLMQDNKGQSIICNQDSYLALHAPTGLIYVLSAGQIKSVPLEEIKKIINETK